VYAYLENGVPKYSCAGKAVLAGITSPFHSKSRFAAQSV
jgi:hypothetical protein